MFKDVSAQEARRKFSRALPIFARLEELPIPTVAAVQGFCFAAGLEIVLCCDIVIAAQSARFAQVEVHIATSTLLGGAQRLTEQVGPARAREIIYDGRQYSEETFEWWNIINRVVPDEMLPDEALALVHKYAQGPTRAYAVGKQLVRAALEGGTRAADRLILDIAAPLFETEDMQHSVTTLLQYGSRNVQGKTTFHGR